VFDLSQHVEDNGRSALFVPFPVDSSFHPAQSAMLTLRIANREKLLEQQVSSKEKEVTSAKQEVTTLRTKLNQEEKKLTQLKSTETQLEDLKQKNNELEQTISQLQTQLVESENQTLGRLISRLLQIPVLMTARIASMLLLPARLLLLPGIDAAKQSTIKQTPKIPETTTN